MRWWFGGPRFFLGGPFLPQNLWRGVTNDAAAVSRTKEAHNTTDLGSEPIPPNNTAATTGPTGTELLMLFYRRTSNATLKFHPNVIVLSSASF